VSYNLSSDLILRYGTSWSVDDRFRTRSLNTLLTANWDGAKFQGPLTALQPGVGYEVRVRVRGTSTPSVSATLTLPLTPTPYTPTP